LITWRDVAFDFSRRGRHLRFERHAAAFLVKREEAVKPQAPAQMEGEILPVAQAIEEAVGVAGQALHLGRPEKLRREGISAFLAGEPGGAIEDQWKWEQAANGSSALE
jgi:hypothetical protein